MIAGIAILLGGLFAVGLFVDPDFPSIKIDRAELLSPNAAPAQPLAGSEKPPMIFGFHVPWNENSFLSLKANSSHMTHVVAEWLILEHDNGDLRDLTEPQVVEWAHDVNLPLLAMVTNFRDGQWRTAEHLSLT
jgi:hypothetical protein